MLLAQDIDPGVQRREKKAERVFRLAIATGRAERNIAADLRGTLMAVSTTHFAATTDPDPVGQLLRAIDGYQGQPSVMHALTAGALYFPQTRGVERRKVVRIRSEGSDLVDPGTTHENGQAAYGAVVDSSAGDPPRIEGSNGEG